MCDDSCLHFRPGVIDTYQGKRNKLELYFTFKLLAGKDAAFQFQFEFTFTSKSSHFGLYVTFIDKYVVPPFSNCILPFQSEAVHFLQISY